VNGGQPVSNARLTVHAQRDGKDVESFQLIASLSLVQGETAIEQRYIPGTGFTTGTWSFSLTLESIDPATRACLAPDRTRDRKDDRGPLERRHMEVRSGNGSDESFA